MFISSMRKTQLFIAVRLWLYLEILYLQFLGFPYLVHLKKNSDLIPVKFFSLNIFSGQFPGLISGVLIFKSVVLISKCSVYLHISSIKVCCRHEMLCSICDKLSGVCSP